MTKIKGQIYVPNKDNPLSEDDYDLILPQTTADQIEGFSGKATQEDAEAGTSDDKVMTPLRVWDAIKKYMTTFMASAVFTGIVKVIAPAIDSNDDSVPTTSWVLSIIQKIFREHVVKDYSIAQNGYIQGGDWVGGLILQWGFSVTLSFESQLYYQHYPISFTVGPFTNILTTVSDEVNGVVYAPTTVNWYKDKFGIVCDYYSNGAYVKPTSVTFISLGI